MAQTTEITSHKTAIPGLLIFDVSKVEDERGYFQEKYQKEKLVKAGMPENFSVVQNSVSYNKQVGVTRGLHAEPWDKYISIISGEVFCAYVDLREGPSFGKLVKVNIDQDKAVFLPKGVANSFQTLRENTYYLYSINAHWSADNYDEYCFVNLNDSDLDISWPIALDKAIISDRDRNHPYLKEIKPLK